VFAVRLKSKRKTVFSEDLVREYSFSGKESFQ